MLCFFRTQHNGPLGAAWWGDRLRSGIHSRIFFTPPRMPVKGRKAQDRFLQQGATILRTPLSRGLSRMSEAYAGDHSEIRTMILDLLNPKGGVGLHTAPGRIISTS